MSKFINYMFFERKEMNITTKKEGQNMKSLNRQAKALLIALAVAAFLPLSSIPMAHALDVNAVPELNSSINGGYVGTNADNTNKFDVNMAEGLGTGGVAQFDWNKFDVGSNKTVDFIFTNTSQTAINRVINGGKISEIYGKMISSSSDGCPSCGGTGKVILINPNGITFGQGSVVNINAFTASTQDINGMRNINTLGSGAYGGLVKDPANSKNYINGTVIKDDKGNVTNVNFFKDANSIIGKFGYTAPITYDRAVTIGQINPNGEGTINYSPIISANGAAFNVENGANKDTNAKSLAFVGNTVDIRNSLVRTTTPDNGGHSLSPYNRSDIKIVTGDGVTFKYQPWGDIGPVDTKTVKASTIGDGVKITGSMVESGGILIENNVAGKDIDITATNVISTKLDNMTSGSMYIESAQGNVNITKSNLATTTQSGNKDSENKRGKNMTFGNMDIIAGSNKNVNITDSKLQTADSDLNNTRNAAGKLSNGNINIMAGSQIIVNNTNDENVTIGAKEHNSIIAGGDLTMQAGKEIKIDLGNKTSGRKVVAQGIDGISNNVTDRNVIINGQAVEIKNAVVSGGMVDVWAGRGNSASNDGVVKISDSSIHSYGDMLLRGYITTLKDSLISYNTLTLDNGYNETNIPEAYKAYPWLYGNDVEIIGSTTFYDKMVENGQKDTLLIDTNGQLVLTGATLKKQGFSENAASTDTNTQLKEQTANIKLASKYSQVSVREGSDIKTNGNITLDGHTNASVSQSNLTSYDGDITLNAGTKVTIGDVDRNGNVGNGSNLTAKNINLNVAKDGNLVADHYDPSWDPKNPTAYLGENRYGITILNSNLTANGGSTTAKVWKDGGVIALKSTNITSTNNNTIYNEGGKISIEHGADSKGNQYADGSNIVATNGSNLIKSNGNTHFDTVNGSSDYVYIDDSKVTSKGNTEIISAGADVDVRFSEVKSTNGNVYLTQYNNAVIDGANPTLIRESSKISAGNNVYLTVTGAGNSLVIRGLDDFKYGNRIVMEANKNVDLSSANNWNLVKADLIADNGWTSIGSSGLVNLNDVTVSGTTNKIEAATGDISITNNLDIKKGTTSIRSFTGNVKSTGNGTTDNYTNGTIVANNNKVKIDAAKDVKVAISKAAQGGLEVNGQNASSELSSKTVSIALAGNENLGISRIKAGNLNFLETNGTTLKQSNWKKLTAAPNTISASVNNDKLIANGNTIGTETVPSKQVVQSNNTTGYAGKAYIEIANRNGFNLDRDTNDAMNLPGFYDNVDHFDLVSDSQNEFSKHFINFQQTPSDTQIGSASTLLVYNRKVNCPAVPEPGEPSGPVTSDATPIGLDESTFVRMPRHEEGVSLVAPVQNAIADPTANVIMAAARIDVSGASNEEEDEYSF